MYKANVKKTFSSLVSCVGMMALVVGCAMGPDPVEEDPVNQKLSLAQEELLQIQSEKEESALKAQRLEAQLEMQRSQMAQLKFGMVLQTLIK